LSIQLSALSWSHSQEVDSNKLEKGLLRDYEIAMCLHLALTVLEKIFKDLAFFTSSIENNQYSVTLEQNLADNPKHIATKKNCKTISLLGVIVYEKIFKENWCQIIWSF
jgi:hypothetical protein